MTEGMPLTQEEFRRLNRSLMEKILDRASSDPEWKQRLLDDPEAAMAEADFPEARQLREMQASVGAEEEEAEVTGQFYDDRSSCISQPRCDFYSMYKQMEPTYK